MSPLGYKQMLDTGSRSTPIVRVKYEVNRSRIEHAQTDDDQQSGVLADRARVAV